MTLESLARLMMLTPAQAVALPVTIDTAAAKVGLSREELVAQCVAKPRLRSYLAGICRQVTS